MNNFNDFLTILSDDEDISELFEILEPRRKIKHFQDRQNYFETLTDSEFLDRFRLSKNGVLYLLDLIEDDIKHKTNMNNEVSAREMLLLTLRFYATGSFLQVVGDFIGIHKSTASRIVYKVSRTIAALHGATRK